MGIKKKKKNFEGCANSSHGCSLTINRLKNWFMRIFFSLALLFNLSDYGELELVDGAACVYFVNFTPRLDDLSYRETGPLYHITLRLKSKLSNLFESVIFRILRNNIKWEFDRKRFIPLPILPVSCQCIIFERRSRWILSVIVHVNIYVTTTFDDISLAYASLRTRSQCISFPEMSFSK